MSKRNEMVIRLDGQFGGVDEYAAQRDADEIATAMVVASRKLVTKAELRAFAAHLREVASKLEEMAETEE